MAAATRDLIIDKGGYYEKTFTWQDSTRQPYNLTGWTARMQCRETYGSTTIILDLTTENGGLVITPLEGKVTIVIDDLVTAAIPVSRGVYDLELVNTLGNPKKFLRGTIKFPEEVTK